MQKLEPFKQSYLSANLIEASAGTGKTYNITWLFIRYVIEEEIPVQKILVVTFTKAATKELKERLITRINESVRALAYGYKGKDSFLNELLSWIDGKSIDREQAIRLLRDAERTFDKASVFTIHGFCKQVLEDLAFESGSLYDADLIEEDRDFAQEVLDDYWRSLMAQSGGPDADQAFIQYVIGRYGSPEALLDEVGDYLGQPYLHILPEETSAGRFRETLARFKNCFEELQRTWLEQKAVIIETLDPEILAYYKGNMEARVREAEDWITSDFPPGPIPDKFRFFKQSVINTKLKTAAKKEGLSPPTHPFFQQADEFEALQEEVRRLEPAFKKELLEHLRTTFPQKKRDHEVYTYDDLLILLRDALQDSDHGSHIAEKLRAKYPLALVDEFQDTDPVQYEIFRQIYGNSDGREKLFMVGDPKQAIYSFRGADIYAYLKARNDADESAQYSLQYNYRSVPELIQGVNHLFGRMDHPFVIKEIPFQTVRSGKKEGEHRYFTLDGNKGEPMQFWDVNHLFDSAQPSKNEVRNKIPPLIAEEIERLILSGRSGKAKSGEHKVASKDIAVLVRKHKQGEAMRRALAERGIKSVLITRESVFHTDIAYQLELLLRAMSNPGSEGAIRAALTTELMHTGGEELLAMEEEDQRWADVVDQFSEWHTSWQEQGFAYMFRQFIAEQAVTGYLVKKPDGERLITNLLHLGELLERRENEHQSGPHSLVKWLVRKRKQDKKTQDEEELRLESDENLVQIVTIHKSKGLEYPIVFCPYLWEGADIRQSLAPFIFHEAHDGETRAILEMSSVQNESRRQHFFQKLVEDLAEEVRLAYVALTRAKQRCYAPWVYANQAEASPLGYLLFGREKVLSYLKNKADVSSEPVDFEPERAWDTFVNAVPAKLFGFEVPSNKEEKTESILSAEDTSRTLEVRTFQHKDSLSPSFAISSFSSLTQQGHKQDLPDYEPLFDELFVDKSTEPAGTQQSMFTFPKGPQPGTCIHQIFEEIDFHDPVKHSEIIQRNLSKYGIGESWEPVVLESIRQVLSKPLPEINEDFRLSSLTNQDRVSELEFYYPTGHIELEALVSIIRKEKPGNIPVNGFSGAGFLKGFVDLTFYRNGKYYILDYKTNYLGDTVGDYRPEHLHEEMRQSFYDLQYHIYSIALHRFLTDRLPGYSYSANFGGVLYLFVRGVNPGGPEGIYYDVPSEDVILEMDEYLQGERLQ